MPVWQRYWDERGSAGARLVTVAIDAEPEAARRFAETITHKTLLDPDAALGRILRLRAIPNGLAFDQSGALVGARFSNFDIRTIDTQALVGGWLEGTRDRSAAPSAERATEEALALFARGSRLLRAGDRRRALGLWHAAYLCDSENFVIRKQIWRELYPERFGDPLDLEWQKEQISREKEVGFTAANPALPAPAE